MSTLSSVTNSAGASYAAQLASSSSLERSLYNIGTAIQNGNLTSAGSILSSLMAANPQFAAAASSSSGDSSQSQNPINQDFQNLTSAISSNQLDAAKSAWTQLQNDLQKEGISTSNSGSDLAAQAVAQEKESENQTLLASVFNGASNGSSLVDALLGGSSGSGNSSASLNSLVSNWVTYKDNGGLTPSANPITGTANSLDALA